ncbi:collagen-binding domain-containing protein [Tundrisphaera lichenicola]|uniref:collagen-binding domain-containing protein n=1 Tax=Tundrisphaera lichenicola TaxID=2029860 RepID=UPI003EB88BB9
MHRTILLAASLLAAATQLASAGITLSDYNLITTGDVTTNSDVQGRVLVGGTLKSNNFTFGGQLAGGALTPPAGIFNALAGNVTNLNTNGHNFIYGSGPASVNGVAADPSTVTTFTDGLSSYLADVSAAYAALTTNSTVDASDPNQIKFNAMPTTINGRSVAVFSIDQSLLTQSGTVSALTGVGAGTTVIINVMGGNAINYFSSGLNFAAFSNLANEAHLLFNFQNATALNGFNNFGGSILAPNADLTTSSSPVGSIYVKSITQIGEIDLPRSFGSPRPGFEGYVPPLVDPSPNPVPEPATILSTLSGLAIVGAGWLRRRRAA